MEHSEAMQNARIATEEDAGAIRQIYRLVQIDPDLFLEIASFPDHQTTPLQLIRSLGGFISPPTDEDMVLTLRNGLTIIYVQNEEVIAYNRVVTQADKVHGELCSELLIDPALRAFSHESFSGWKGNKKLHTGKTLKCVHWVDKDQALLAFNAATAGLEDKPCGRLAWAVDSAVHPGYRNSGVSRGLIKRLNSELRPSFQYRVFRIFEILRINQTDIAIENSRSKQAFINSSSKHFAYTEEEVIINNAVTLSVRWNYWLRHL